MENSFTLKSGMILGAAMDSGELVLDEFRKKELLTFSRTGLHTCRFNLNWKQIEPEEGVFDEVCLSNIKEDVIYMVSLGVRPLVCLSDEREPLWFNEKGGWSKTENALCFLIYAEKVIRTIGHIVSDYLTFSNINLRLSHARNISKGKSLSRSEYYNAMSIAAFSHCRAYRLIHDVRREMGFKNSRVSFANSYSDPEPNYVVAAVNKISNGAREQELLWLLGRAMMLGDFRFPLRRFSSVRKSIYSDFHAVNYVSFRRTAMIEKFIRRKKGEEYDADGIVEVCAKLYKMLKLTIYVTEVSSPESKDVFRCVFIYDHLKYLCDCSLPLRRFYYGTFFDYSDEDGGTVLGLAEINDEGVILRRSGNMLGLIAEHNRVTEEIYNEYVDLQ